jgi:hypothetical protein
VIVGDKETGQGVFEAGSNYYRKRIAVYRSEEKSQERRGGGVGVVVVVVVVVVCCKDRTAGVSLDALVSSHAVEESRPR